MSSARAVPFAVAVAPLRDVQALDATQWQQQREALLAMVAEEDRRRAGAAQQVVAGDPTVKDRGCAAIASYPCGKFASLEISRSVPNLANANASCLEAQVMTGTHFWHRFP